MRQTGVCGLFGVLRSAFCVLLRLMGSTLSHTVEGGGGHGLFVLGDGRGEMGRMQRAAMETGNLATHTHARSEQRLFLPQPPGSSLSPSSTGDSSVI